MSEKSTIAWTDSTINFWSGCTKVSPGCANCYAEARDKRHMIEPVSHWGKGAPRLKHKGAVKDALAFNRQPWICDECGEPRQRPEEICPECESQPTHYTSPITKVHRRRIFSLSLGDWLDDEVPIEWLAEMLDTIRQCDQVTWILCTKRPENFTDRLMEVANDQADDDGEHSTLLGAWIDEWLMGVKIPSNIILLTSVENQEQADIRIPQLLRIPAACRGLSLEPLLGGVDLELQHGCRGCNHPGNIVIHWNEHGRCSICNGSGHEPSGIDWLIIGGESGTNARPCNVDWIRRLVAQGKCAGVATFVKQLGTKPVWTHIVPGCSVREFDESLDLHDKKGGDPDEWPADLRVQEWPMIPRGTVLR